MEECVIDRFLTGPLQQDTNKDKIQAAVDRIRKELSNSIGMEFPSISVLIETPHEKIFVSSEGESAQVVTPHTYYRFASNTKTFTSTAILKMFEDEWLDYKAKIKDEAP